MYTLADLEFNNIASNYASSVRVPYGLTLELYDHDGFSCTKKTVTGSMFIDTFSQEFPSVNINGDLGSITWHHQPSSLAPSLVALTATGSRSPRQRRSPT